VIPDQVDPTAHAEGERGLEEFVAVTHRPHAPYPLAIDARTRPEGLFCDRGPIEKTKHKKGGGRHFRCLSLPLQSDGRHFRLLSNLIVNSASSYPVAR
jgi:hypothetical protein